MEYLRIVCDYATDPVEHAFALLGTRVHRKLDMVAKKIEQVISEHTVQDSETIGTLDLIEPDELYPDSYKLVDMKTWGSYSLAKVLKRKENGESDILKAMLQLNGYRVKVEPLGFPISRLFILAIVRDGGTFTAKNNNVPEKMMMIPIERMPDNEVNEYFSEKAHALLDALYHKQVPRLCNFDDRWGNRRCGGYCDVVAFCKEGAAMAKIKYDYGTKII